MELAGKIVVYLELKSSAEYFFKVLGREAHRIPGKATDKIHGIDVHEGDWVTTGSIKQWSYTIGGVTEVFKEKMHIDEENNFVTFTAVEGSHVLEQYKRYSGTFKFFPKADGNILELSLEYEKIKAEDPRPNHYVDFIIGAMRDIDAHLVEAKIM